MGVSDEMRRRAVLAALAAILPVPPALAMSPATASAPGGNPPCTAAASAGGEWTSYGHDALNTRSQPDEHAINAARAGSLALDWVFRLSSAGTGGQVNSTPVVAGGCVFVTASNGGVYALDAATGKLVWDAVIPVHSAGFGGAIVGGAALGEGGTVIVLVNEAGDGHAGPTLVAFDRSSGQTVWRSAPIVNAAGYYTNATPQVFDGIVFAGFSPPEGDSTGQGGFALLDAASGAILKTTTTVSPADQAKGFAGGGIWSTPAFDAQHDYAYVGAGNPFSKQIEDVHTNAILKIDMSRARATFGQIVASYKGNVDQYTQALTALERTPVCSASTGLPSPLDDPACGQLDLDFGAAPNLFAAGGRLLVGDLQKSGVYHVADATTMRPRWATIVGLSCQACNAASTAADAGSVFGVSTPGGLAFSLSQADGSRRWLSPVLDGVHYDSISTANGVVYTIDGSGFLDAFDEATGVVLLHRPVSADVGAPASALSSAGVSIAEHSLFVAAGDEAQSDGFIVAYH